MKLSITSLISTALLSVAFQLSATTTTIVSYTPPPNSQGAYGVFAPGFDQGSFQAVGPGKSEIYIAPSQLFSSPVKISDIASISYYTNKPGDGTQVDWTFYLYTNTTGTGDTGSFYHTRLNSEPYFAQATAPGNTWHQWTTGVTPNQSMRFYDADRTGVFGTYNDPFLSQLQSGPITWNSFGPSYGVAGQTYGPTSIDYSNELIKYFSFQTGSAWSSGFNGYLDGFRVTLTNGDIGVVNFDAIPEPSTVVLIGVGLAALVQVKRRRRA